MRFLIVLLVLAFSLPAIAQEKKAEKKTEKKAAKKAEKKPAKKTEKTTAQPKQEWGRFSSNAQKDEKERAQKAAKDKQ
jgi:choline-glycine betaine transporter